MASGRPHAWLRHDTGSHPVHDLKWFLTASLLALAGVGGAGALYEGACEGWLPLPRGWVYGLGFGLGSLLVIGLAAMALCRRVREVRASEGRFRNLLESAPDAIIITGRDGRIALVNSQAERLFGHTRAEVEGRPLDDLLRKEVRDVGVHSQVIDLSTLRARPWRQAAPEFVGRHKDGS